MTSKVKGWLLLILAIAFELTASLSLKAALETPGFYSLVVLGYVAAFTALSLVLRTGMALGIAYGLWGASGVVLTAILSFVIFSEPISLLTGIGLAIVVVGVLCVELGARASQKTNIEVSQ